MGGQMQQIVTALTGKMLFSPIKITRNEEKVSIRHRLFINYH